MSTKRNAILVAVMALAVTGSTFGIASAQETGPDTEACTNAKAADKAADDALRADNALVVARNAFSAQRSAVAALSGVDGNFINDPDISVDDINGAINTAPDGSILDAELIQLRDALQAQLKAADTADDTDAVALVAVADKTDADKLCKAPATTEPPAPTTEPEATTAPPVVVNPSAPPTVVVVPQVPVKPSGGVETGDGSLA